LVKRRKDGRDRERRKKNEMKSKIKISKFETVGRD